jgi:2-aminoethylphosphonate-pyruvate transaminase
VYGERLAKIARSHGIEVAEVSAPWTSTPPLDQLQALLADRDDIDALAAVHHETTTGLLNPVAEMGAIARDTGVSFILDAISSMACDPLDIEQVQADFVCGTANKGFHGLPGISFVYVSPHGRERAAQVPARSLYLSISSYLTQQERGDVPFTPAVQICYALDEALDEMAERGGAAARVEEYAGRASLVRGGLDRLGLQLLLPPEAPRANAVTAVRLPAGLSYATLHDGLKEQGYIIYAGQGKLSAEIFRIATMGELSPQILQAFLTALESIVLEYQCAVPT